MQPSLLGLRHAEDGRNQEAFPKTARAGYSAFHKTASIPPPSPAIRNRKPAPAVFVENDGTILAAGDSVGGFTIVHYESNGTLDSSFGQGGIVYTEFPTTKLFGDPNTFFALSQIMLQPDGKILALGSFEHIVACPEFACITGQQCPCCDRSSEFSAFGLIRFNSDGSIDTSFGEGGEVASPFALRFAYAESFVLLPDGSIVVAGTAADINTGIIQPKVALARYSANGVLDPNFGDNGEILTGFGTVAPPFGHIRAALDNEGRIIVAGASNAWQALLPIQPGDANHYDFFLLRYQEDGKLDTSFGDQGQATADFGTNMFPVIEGVHVQSNGRINVVVNVSDAYSYIVDDQTMKAEIGLARFVVDDSKEPPTPDSTGAKAGPAEKSLVKPPSGIGTHPPSPVPATASSAPASSLNPVPAAPQRPLSPSLLGGEGAGATVFGFVIPREEQPKVQVLENEYSSHAPLPLLLEPNQLLAATLIKQVSPADPGTNGMEGLQSGDEWQLDHGPEFKLPGSPDFVREQFWQFAPDFQNTSEEKRAGARWAFWEDPGLQTLEPMPILSGVLLGNPPRKEWLDAIGPDSILPGSEALFLLLIGTWNKIPAPTETKMGKRISYKKVKIIGP